MKLLVFLVVVKEFFLYFLFLELVSQFYPLIHLFHFVFLLYYLFLYFVFQIFLLIYLFHFLLKFLSLYFVFLLFLLILYFHFLIYQYHLIYNNSLHIFLIFKSKSFFTGYKLISIISCFKNTSIFKNIDIFSSLFSIFNLLFFDNFFK